MRAPSFWSKPAGPFAGFLAVAGTPYHLATRLRFALGRPKDVGVPVICVGNFTAGGAGKTPTVIAIAKHLISQGHNPIFLSKGYGGSTIGPVLVDATRHLANQVGDEPLLLCRTGPVIVAKNRLAGARAAIEAGADIIIMDDGLQDPSLKKAVTIAIVDGQTGIGNGQVIPAGPLRARIGFQLSHTDAILLVGTGKAGEQVSAQAKSAAIPCFQATIQPSVDAPQISGKKILAFAGIGRPEKFFQTLRETGAEIVDTISYSDHHVFNDADALHLLECAKKLDAALFTTEKDLVRISNDGAQKELKRLATGLPVELAFVGDGLAALIHKKIGEKRR